MSQVLDKEIYIVGSKSCLCGGTQYSCPPHELKFSSSSNIYYMSFIMEQCNVLSKIYRKAKQKTNNWYWIGQI